MNYMLIIYESQAAFSSREGTDREAYWASWRAYSQALSDAKVIRGGGALQPPSTATSVRHQDGKRRIQDGPFADTKEQLGGYYIIEVENLDQALEWAARCPAHDGCVEVRPLIPMS